MLKEMERARFVRIIPISWHGQTRLQFEVIGCKRECKHKLELLVVFYLFYTQQQK